MKKKKNEERISSEIDWCTAVEKRTKKKMTEATDNCQLGSENRLVTHEGSELKMTIPIKNGSATFGTIRRS